MLHHSLAKHGHRVRKGERASRAEDQLAEACESCVVSPVGVKFLSGWAAHSQGAQGMSQLPQQLQPMQESHATPSWADMQDTILTYPLPQPQSPHSKKEEGKMCEQTHQRKAPLFLVSRATV